MTTYSLLWHFVFPVRGFALCSTRLENSVFSLGFYFSMTNRRILSQLHDVFPEVFYNDMCSSSQHLVAFNNLGVWEQYGFRRGMFTENTALKLTNVLCSNQNKLYAFMWVFPRRLKFIFGRFGTLCSISQAGMCEEWMCQPTQASN